MIAGRGLRAGLDIGVVSGRGRTGRLLDPGLGLSLSIGLPLILRLGLGLASYHGTRRIGCHVWFSLSGFVFLWKSKQKSITLAM